MYDIVKLFIKCFDVKVGWMFYGYEDFGVCMMLKIFICFKFLLDYKMKYVQKFVCFYFCFIVLVKGEVIDFVV